MLTVVEFDSTDVNRNKTWKCKCDCGKFTFPRGSNLRNGSILSCGCQRTVYKPENVRTVVGNNVVKISKELLIEMRDFIKVTKTKTQAELVVILAKKYPQYAAKTLPGYINACSVSDRIFQLYLEGKFSFGMLRVLGTCDTPSTADFLAEEVLERKMATGQVEEAKSLVKNKKCRSWDEAIKQAMGIIEDREPTPPREKKTKYQKSAEKEGSSLMPGSFEELIQDILISGTNWRMKVQMAIDMMPLAKESKAGESSFMVFGKLYMLRHALKENLEFIDKNIKEALDTAGAVVSMDSSDADFTAKENDHEIGRGTGRGSEGGDAAETVAEGDGQAVPPPGPRVIQGEGRVRS